jgi:hypothetical protein
LHVFIADAPKIGVLWEVWFAVTFNVFLRVVSQIEVILICVFVWGGADKSLAWPGTKQATATEDFDIHISYL